MVNLPCPTVRRKSPDQDIRLMEAARLGDAKVVAELLTEGVAIDDTDGQGSTALILAAMAGHPEIVRLLLDAGANSSITDDMGYDARTATVFFGDFRGATMPPFDEILASFDENR